MYIYIYIHRDMNSPGQNSSLWCSSAKPLGQKLAMEESGSADQSGDDPKSTLNEDGELTTPRLRLFNLSIAM